MVPHTSSASTVDKSEKNIFQVPAAFSMETDPMHPLNSRVCGFHNKAGRAQRKLPLHQALKTSISVASK
jgi:hypothetical protein